MNNHFSVPWICKTELLCVYQNLYSESVGDRQNAIQHIAVWKARCNPWQFRLPVSIICSADLIGAELDHHLYTRRESALTEKKVSQSLALALIRFVNFITERYQHDSSNVAIPIHRICAEIGIPAWIVGLRHEATHRALPALSVLTRGAQWAICWLKENFWEQQKYGPPRSNSFTILTDGESVSAVKSEVDGPTGTTVGNSKISSLFVAYQQIRCQELSGRGFSRCDITTGVECKEVINEIKKLFSLGKNRVVSVLVQTGYLLPSDDQLADLGIKPGLQSDENIRCVLVVFWWPLLQELNNIRVISQLVQTLALMMTDSECPRKTYILIWLQILLSRDAVKFIGGGEAQLFSNSIPFLKVPWLRQCLQNPNQYTEDVLQMLSCGELASLPKEVANKLSSLLNIYREQGAAEPCSGSDAYTEQRELPVAPDYHSPIDCDGGNTLGSPWQRCTEKVDWLHLPVGIHPWQDTHGLYHSLNDYCKSVYLQKDIQEHYGVCEIVDNSSSCEPSAYCWNMNQHHLIQSHLIIYQ